jgi:hypothetical protein
MKIFLFLFLLFLTGCTNGKDEIKNNDKFEDYVPWWTNKIETVTNTINGGQYVIFRQSIQK